MNEACPTSAPRWAVHRRTCVHGVALDLKLRRYTKGASVAIYATWTHSRIELDGDELDVLEAGRQRAALAFAASLGVSVARLVPASLSPIQRHTGGAERPKPAGVARFFQAQRLK